jgi:DNA-binding MarR family transcriptional regulator
MSADKSSGGAAGESGPPAEFDADRLLAESGLPPARQSLLARGHVVFRSYLTAEIMLAHVTAKALGLSSAEFFGLNIVSLRGPVTAGELAHATGLTSGAATRMIDRLEAAGLVRRVHDTGDRRRVLVGIATDRLAEIDAVLEPSRRRLAEVFLSYTDEQLSLLFDYFERATPALLAAAEDLRGF